MNKRVYSYAFANFRCWYNDRLLPIECYDFFRYPCPLDEHIAVVCGYKDISDMDKNYRDETDQLLVKLGGEHGWTVYKMLLAVRDKAAA